MRLLGIDNGINGGLAMLEAHHIMKKIMPTAIQKSGKKKIDGKALLLTIVGWAPDHVYLERSQPMPRQGTVSMFNYGESFGLIQGILIALQMPYTLVRPQEWQKGIFGSTFDKRGTTKDMGFNYCRKRWPDEKWIATERSKKFHNGLTDAACIAAYGQIKVSQ